VSNLKGYLFAAIAAASYGTNPIFAIPLYREGISVTSVLFMRYAMAVAIMFFATMIKSPKAFVIKPKYVGLLAFMGILMVLSSIALFESYKYLSAGIASTLLFFYPVIVAVIMAIFYKERLTKKSWACLVTAFLGVVILSKNDDGGFISLLGLTLVMLSSLSYAIYLVYINRGPMKKINTSTITFYVILGGFLVMIPYCLLDGGLMLPKTTPAWINAIGLGFFPTVISLIFTSRAIALIGSTETAIFGALEPLTAVILGILILGETLTITPAIGMILIFTSVTVLMMKKK
jgi:drug/metabolite transporter (DMT)-like permease